MQRKRQGAQHCFAHKRILSSLLRPGSYATPICDFWSRHWHRSAPNLRDSYEKRQGLLIQRHNPGHCWNPIQFTSFFPRAEAWKWMLCRQQAAWRKIGSGTATDQTALWMQSFWAERTTSQRKTNKQTKKYHTSAWQDLNFQYQHTLSYLSVPRRQIQFNSAEADLMSGDVLGWSSRNLAIWKLILCLKCSVVCRSGEVYHNTLRLVAQAALAAAFIKTPRSRSSLSLTGWFPPAPLHVIMFSSEATLHDIASYCC